MKPLCIYHGGCDDGFAAAWVVRKALKGNTKTKDFDEARVAMRDDGWHARKVCGEWLHGCDSCGAPS